jgi:ABC-2 type transport system ATP-binding protein
MIQRIGIAQALMNDPEIVFLDEPTSGLDPIGSLQMREIILQMRERNKTVFLCSHLLSEVERICDHVTILHNGRTVRQGAVVDLLEAAGTFAISARGVSDAALERLGQAAKSVHTSEGITEVTVESQDDALRLAGIVAETGAELLSVGRRRRSLEDVFVESTEEAL